ncbi:MAG: DNRLRE domain-containing protein [Bacteroidetes bacterium]|nr:DNRLRE domain-containing protein [Bacteroidota bacterium]
MKRVYHFLLVNLMILALSAEQLSAQYQKLITPDKDAVVFSAVPNNNYGSSSILSIQNSAYNGAAESFLYFSLLSIPSNATITSAKLELYCSFKQNNPVISIGKAGVGSWSENWITWSNSPAFSATSAGNVGSLNSYTEYDVTNFVNDWYSGNQINNGFVIACGSSESSATFSSREGSYSPKLIVNYSILPSIPEPYLPVNTSVDNPINPVITWKSANYADSYRLQVSTNSNFSSFVFNQGGITGTSQQVTNLIYGTNYYWRVCSTNLSGTSAYSTTWSFKTIYQLQLTVLPDITYTRDWNASIQYVINVTDNNNNAISGAMVSVTDNLMGQTIQVGPTSAGGQITYTTTVPNGKANGTYNLTFVGSKTGYFNSSTTTRSVIVDHTTQSTRTLTIASSNPNSGVNISVSPNDNNNLGNGSTPFTRTFNNNTSVTLTAPASASGNNFLKWQRNGSDYLTTQSITFSLDADYTFTAVYQTPPPTTRTLTVASSNPNSGVNISVSPNDNNNLGNGSTPLTRTFNNNTS